MKLLRCQSPGEVTAGILGSAGAEAPTCARGELPGASRGRRGPQRRGRMLLGLAETLTQIHPHSQTVAVIQNDTLKRTQWLH